MKYPVNEKLIQYIWQFQLFNKTELLTVASNTLSIIHPGTININQGPDFLNGKIVTENATWFGNIEIHVKSSDWDLHKHSEDERYNNVVLHVVWDHDKELNLPFPTLELKQYVPKLLLDRYHSLHEQNQFIPCEKNIIKTDSLSFEKWKESLVVERLQRKSIFIKSELLKTNHNWKLVFWYAVARAFGGNLNGDAFVEILKSIPFNSLLRQHHSLLTVEAVLMGQAGFLNDDFNDDYHKQLKIEYAHFKLKYELETPKISLLFLRMRPSNFPTIRLAQFASFICKNANSIYEFIQLNNVSQLESYFDIETAEYWNSHFCFDEPSKFKIKKIGEIMQLNIIINAIAPFQFAYGVFMEEEVFIQQAIETLINTSTEKNKIIERFKVLGLKTKNAFDSQFLLELKNQYCDNKKCLNCQIGASILS